MKGQILTSDQTVMHYILILNNRWLRSSYKLFAEPTQIMSSLESTLNIEVPGSDLQDLTRLIG